MRRMKLFAFVMIASISSVPAIETPRLKVVGPDFKDPSGTTVVLRGISILDCSWSQMSELERITDTTKKWYPRVVRLPVHPENFLGKEDAAWRDKIKPKVDFCKAKGVYCIIDWHYIADPAGKDSETRAFWNYVAPKLKDEPHVIYEVFNEPSKDIAWADWKKIAQPWIDLIRTHAPQTIILVGGPQYCQHIRDAATSPFTTANVAYVAHCYPGSWLRGGFEGEVGVVAQKHPVVVTEWGYGGDEPNETKGTQSGFGDPFKAFCEKYGISWTAWVAHNSAYPRMFWSDWSVRRGSDYHGGFAQDWLYDKRNSDVPQEGIPTAVMNAPALHIAAKKTPGALSVDALGRVHAAIDYRLSPRVSPGQEDFRTFLYRKDAR